MYIHNLQEAEARIGPVIIRALGLATQRETTIVWSKVTGLPLHNAIVWLDSRTRCVLPGWAPVPWFAHAVVDGRSDGRARGAALL